MVLMKATVFLTGLLKQPTLLQILGLQQNLFAFVANLIFLCLQRLHSRIGSHLVQLQGLGQQHEGMGHSQVGFMSLFVNSSIWSGSILKLKTPFSSSSPPPPPPPLLLLVLQLHPWQDTNCSAKSFPSS